MVTPPENTKYRVGQLRIVADLGETRRKNGCAIVDSEQNLVVYSKNIGELLEWFYERDILTFEIQTASSQYLTTIQFIPEKEKENNG